MSAKRSAYSRLLEHVQELLPQGGDGARAGRLAQQLPDERVRHPFRVSMSWDTDTCKQ